MLPCYWKPMPDLPAEDVPGKLIVLEGTDGVGRSTQTGMLKTWMESSGLAVYDTGLTRSNLAGAHLQAAKQGHTMGGITQALFYATDFADRLQNEMLPALRAGYIVLTDRYIYSLMARAIVRGADTAWMRHVYGFALVPHVVLYLKADLEALVPRVLSRGGFDYWESGADYIHADSRYDCFVQHQQALLRAFEQMIDEYGFVVVDANRPVRQVFEDLRGHVSKVIADVKPSDLNLAAAPDPEEFMSQPLRPEAPRRDLSDVIADLLGALQDE